MRFVKYLVMGLGVLILIAGVGLAIMVSQFNPDDYRGRIAESIAKTTGRDVQLRGSIGVTFGLTPVVTVADFSLGNMPGGSRPEMLKAAKLEVSMALLPLLMERRLEVTSLAVDGVDLLLERLADGRANWRFAAAAAGDGSAGAGGSAAQKPMSLPAINALVMTRTSLIWRDGAAAPRSLTIDKLEASLPRDGSLSLSVSGVLDGVAVGAVAKLRSLAGVLAGAEPVPGTATIKLAGASVEVDGRFGPGAAYEGKLSAQAPAMASLLALAGHQGPEPGALALSAQVAIGPAGVTISDGKIDLGEGGDRLSAKLSGKVSASGVVDLAVAAEAGNTRLFQRFGAPVPDGAFALRTAISGTAPLLAAEGVDVKIGDSRAQGRIALERLSPSPKLAIDLGIDQISLATGGAGSPPPAAGASPPSGVASSSDGRVIPVLPLPWDGLSKLDAAAVFRIGAVTSGALQLQSLQLRAALVGGALSVPDLEFGFAGGHWAIEASAKAADRSLGVKAKAEGVDAVALAKALGVSPAVDSKMALSVELAGQGADLRSVLASAHGLVILDVAGGTMSPSLFKGSAGALARILLAGRADEDVRMECGVVHAPIQAGLARIAEGVVETQKVGLATSGTISLVTEKLALRVDPTTRDAALQALAPAVLIGGSMGAPEVAADRAGVAVGAIATLGALAAGRNPLMGGAAGPSALENCAAARAGKSPTPVAAPTSSPGQIAPAATRPGSAAPNLPDAFKSLLDGLGRRR